MYLRLDCVVAVGDRGAHDLLRTRQKLARKQLDELVLNVLDEVKLGHALMVHDKDGEEAVRVLDARVCHLDEDVSVLLKVYHQLLLLLHVAELVLINTVRVVEEQVVLTRQLNFDLLDLISTGPVEQ